MELTDLLKHRNPDLKYEDREEKIKHLLILTEELQQVANDNLNNISQDLFNMTEAHHFVLKQEVIAEKSVLVWKTPLRNVHCKQRRHIN
jgi:hypothetical protein